MTFTSRIFCVLLLPLTVLACSAEPAPAAQASPETEEDKVLYALGLALAQPLGGFGLSEAEFEMVKAGITAAALGSEPAVNLQEYGPKVQQLAEARIAASADQEKSESAAFVAEQANGEGATTTESGIVITEMNAGTGASPTAASRVSVHYHGTLRDGTVFDSSVDRGAPASFGLNQVIACWGEALQTMKVGGKIRIVCPSELAYGDQGQGAIVPGSALVFEVELLEILQ